MRSVKGLWGEAVCSGGGRGTEICIIRLFIYCTEHSVCSVQCSTFSRTHQLLLLLLHFIDLFPPVLFYLCFSFLPSYPFFSYFSLLLPLLVNLLGSLTVSISNETLGIFFDCWNVPVFFVFITSFQGCLRLNASNMVKLTQSITGFQTKKISEKIVQNRLWLWRFFISFTLSVELIHHLGTADSSSELVCMRVEEGVGSKIYISHYIFIFKVSYFMIDF